MTCDSRISARDPLLRPADDPLDRLVAWFLVSINLARLEPPRTLSAH